MHYTSGTEYSDEDDSEEEEDDDISVCSGSTISAGGQSCTASDLMSSGFDDAYCAGRHQAGVVCMLCRATCFTSRMTAMLVPAFNTLLSHAQQDRSSIAQQATSAAGCLSCIVPAYDYACTRLAQI